MEKKEKLDKAIEIIDNCYKELATLFEKEKNKNELKSILNVVKKVVITAIRKE